MKNFEISNLDLAFSDGTVVRDIFKNASIEFESGKVYGIMGRSGSGKSSFISVVSGLLSPNNVNIKYNNVEINYKQMTGFRKENIALVFQDYNLIDYLSPIQNISVASSIQVKEKLEKDFITYLLDLVGISIVNSRKAVQKLSGGEKQRVAIARALSADAPIILTDEPTGNLDEENEILVMELFKKIAAESDKIVIVVTHSNEVAAMCDCVYRIEDRGFVNVTL